MKPKLNELRQRIEIKKTEMRAMNAKAEGEDRDLTPDEKSAWDTMVADVAALDARVARLEEDDEDAEPADGERSDEDAEVEPPARRSAPPVIDRARVKTRSISPRQAPAVHTIKHEYSILRAIDGMSDRNNPRLTGLEKEWHQEICTRSGRQAQGFFVPHHFANRATMERASNPTLAVERRALNLTSAAGMIPTITDASLIEYLYNRTMVIIAGAVVITDMETKFALPRMSTTANASWVGDGAAPAGSNAVIDQVLFTPTTIAAFTDISRKTLKQSSVDAELVVRSDLSRQIGLGIDYASLNGSGTNNQPLGIEQNELITTISLGANSAVPDFPSMVELETNVAIGNADLGALKYMTSAAGRGRLKQTVKNAGTGYPVYLCENNEVNGYPLLATNQIPSNLTVGTSTNACTNMTFGNWNDLVISLFGALDVLVDPYTGSSSNTVRVNIFQDADIKVRHEASFCNLIFLK